MQLVVMTIEVEIDVSSIVALSSVELLAEKEAGAVRPASQGQTASHDSLDPAFGV